MPSEDYYDKFLRAAGQSQEDNPNEVLEIKITFPNDIKTFRRWVHVWLFVQVMSCMAFIACVPGIVILHPLSIIMGVPASVPIILSYILQTQHRELYQKLYKRYLGKPNV